MKKIATILTSLALLAGSSAYADAVVTYGKKFINHNEFQGRVTNVSIAHDADGGKIIRAVIESQSSRTVFIDADFTGKDAEDGQLLFTLLGKNIIVYTAQSGNNTVISGFQSHTIDG